MKVLKNTRYILISLSLLFAVVPTQTLSAQFTITIPKLPKISKQKIERSKEGTSVTGNDRTKENRTTENNPPAVKDKCSESGWLDVHLGKIAERQTEVSSFTPERGWFTRDFTYDHLLFAVSPSAREKWLKDANALHLKDCPDLVSAFDKLAAAAAEKFPLYQPNPKAYLIRNPAEERMMKATLKNAAAVKIHKIGLNQRTWLISKDDFGLPTSRYKHGFIWLRNPADDHPYCHFYYVNILQDYAGGGTYGASYALFVEDGLAGCPAGK
jgi:hypothetical protein